MKKVLYSILLALFVLFPISVLAEGYISISTSSLTIEQGSSKNFTITAYNTIGDVSITSNNSAIASVSTGDWGTGMVDEKQTKTGSVTVIGNSVGTVTITLTIDAATFDGEDLAGQTKTLTVNVVDKPQPTPQPSPEPTPTPQQPQNNLSTNNNIGSLTVDGYNVEKVDNNNYTLIVNNSVTSINVNANPEDSKATVTGTGKHELNVGENNIEVIVTAESGLQNKINIKVTRKDGYYLEDLDALLKNKDANDVIINKDSKITKENLDKIKESRKQVNFNYYNEDKKLIYSWTLDGSKIDNSNEFITTITNESGEIKNISKLSNYADGLYVNFGYSGKLPKGTKIKIYVGDKFEDSSVVNIYHYVKDKNKLEDIKKNIKVKDGYIEFDVEHCSEYFVTMSNLNIANQKSSINIFMILSIIEFIIIDILILFNFKMSSETKKVSLDLVDNENNTQNDNDIIQNENINAEIEERNNQILNDENNNQIVQNVSTNDLTNNEIQTNNVNNFTHQEIFQSVNSSESDEEVNNNMNQ